MARVLFARISALLIGIACAETALAGGFTNNSIGSKSILMGAAFTGIADDASAVHFNPAGLAFSATPGWNMDTYALYGFTNFDYERNGTKDESDEQFLVPGFLIAKSGQPWSFGLGIYTPWAGGGTKYKNFQNSGHDYKNASAFTALTPALAYKIRPDLSVGAGLSLFYGMLKTKYQDPVTLASVKGDYSGIAGFSGHMALMYVPAEMLKVGLCVKSEFPVNLDGNMKIAGEEYRSHVVFTLPPIFSLGVGYKPWKKLTLGFEITRLLYGNMDEIRFKSSGLPTNHVRTHYKNTWEFKLGGEYQATERLAVRAGFFFTEGATKREGLNAASNDVDLLIPSVGLAYRLTEALEVSVGSTYNGGLAREFAGQSFDQNHWNAFGGTRLNFWAPASDEPS
jgi:long-chain fatty acid transport protein